MQTLDRRNPNEKLPDAGNSTFAIGVVLCHAVRFVVAESFVLHANLRGKNPVLRKYANRKLLIMDKTIEQIFRAFNHIARELQVYFVSGLLVILNVYVIDFFYYDQSFYNIVGKKEFIVPGIIVAYIIGHVCMSFFYVLLELTKFDKKLNKRLGFDFNVDSNVLPNIYEKNKESYIHFIERYVVLTMMRWTLSSAFFINFLVDLYFTLFHEYNWQTCLLTVLNFLASVTMYILTTRTEKDYSDRINSMNRGS